jgi:glycosyltransferase involved in cell wall biosynthesis
MEAHKGVRELLAAVRKIAEPYELLMVGDGRLRSWVADEARRNARVRVLGRLTGDALEEAWERTDIIVVPSICAENAPTVIQEATARGIPVIASAVGGIPEFVEEGVTGWLVPVGNVDALRQAIRARPGSAVTEEMRAAMASHAAEWQGERYLKALRDIIASL